MTLSLALEDGPGAGSKRQVGEISEFVRGVSYQPGDLRPSEASMDAVPLLRATNIINSRVLTEDVLYVARERVRQQQLLRRWDVLIAMSSGSRKAVGKLAQLHEDWHGTFGAFCGVLRPREDLVDPSYFGFALRSPAFRSRIELMAQGTNIKNLSMEHLLGFNLSLPDLNEQRRIARILSVLTAAADTSRSAVVQASSLKQILRDHLLSALDAAPKVPLREMIKLSSGTTRPFDVVASSDDVHPYPIFGGNGVLGFASSFLIDFPTIVIGRVGQYCGAVHLPRGACWISDNALYVKNFLDEIDREYLAAALTWINLNKYQAKSAQPLVTQAAISAIRIPVPGLDEQRRIARMLKIATTYHSCLASEATAKATLASAVLSALLEAA